MSSPNFLGRAREDPKQIGNWKLGRTLGQGAHGRVRIARNAKTGQMAAIKIIPKTYFSSQANSLEDADLEARKHELAMQREVVLLKLIDHPNIMRLYDVWDLPEELYLVLEYVQGGELFDYLCENGALSTAEALSYFQQIILAIDYCHRFNIAHRDLKPENILLDSDFNIKIADFGLAAFQSDQLLHSACGSPHYTAPEVLIGDGYDGIVADVWSCGIILYALLVGRLPFEADELEDLLAKICDGHVDMPSHLDPLARDLITRMLQTDSELRITLVEVQNHPFFLSRPLNASSQPALSLEQIARPLKSREDVDPELFRNLCTLWTDTYEEDLLDSLTNSEENWQKGVYHLLFEYRRKRLEERKKQDQLICAEKNRKKEARRLARKMALARHPSTEYELRPSPSSLPPRAGPPTPRRARTGRIPHDASDESLASNVPSSQPPIQSFLVRLSEHSPDADASPSLCSPGDVVSPSLALMQEIMGGGDVGIKLLSTARTTASPTSERAQKTPFGHSSANVNSIRPLNVRCKYRPRRPTIDTTFLGKENEEDDFLVVDAVPRSADGSRRPSKLRRKHDSHSASPASTLLSPRSARSSLLTPTSGPRASWFANVFKFAKPSAHTLRSTHAVQTTRNECRRLLMAMNVRVSVEDGEGLGMLRCRLEDARDSTGKTKSLKFRVDIQRSTTSQYDGDLFLILVHEKGPMETFKSIYRGLKADWTLDVLGSKTPDQVAINGSLGGRFRSYNVVS
ncbi:serine/threonine-protein kinase gin4 [Stygiomarasmius scandens]|uniref:Serine/threonine-protein kinase gin4 n=1 Tax=Marasmiellus scandens TaxID=2682957 RepID=A0ABR1JSU9_9AGAR